MSDTPRTDALEFIVGKGAMPPFNTVPSFLARDMERELNGSNKIIRQQQLLDEKNLMLKNRIKRLEEAGDAMEEYILDQTNTRFIICATQWREAKEEKQ